MPRYKKFQYNAEVVDVLCCLSLGYNRIGEIVKKLKQPQPTVSAKIGFLVKNKVVLKDKWEVKPNWKVITQKFQSEVRAYLEEILFFGKLFWERGNKLEEIREAIENIPNIFHEERVAEIYKTYAKYFLRGWLKKMSLRDLAFMYMENLKHIDANRFREFRKDIFSIKKLLTKVDIRDIKEDFVREVEKSLKQKPEERIKK